MPLCPAWTVKSIKKSQMAQDPRTGKWDVKTVKPVTKTVMCGCKPVVFVKVSYRELSHHRKGECKYDDLFGLCGQHASALADPAAWNSGGDRWRPGAISGLRGSVERVEPVEMGYEELQAMASQDKVLRIMASVKSDFKRKMRQSNTERLSVDNWRQLFEECVQEWVAEEVMDS